MSLNVISHEATQHATGCALVDIGPYHESLRIWPIARLAGSVELSIESRFDTAIDPDASRLRYRTTLDRAGLVRMKDAIGQAIALLAIQDAQRVGGQP